MLGWALINISQGQQVPWEGDNRALAEYKADRPSVGFLENHTTGGENNQFHNIQPSVQADKMPTKSDVLSCFV